jgi:hypothetical protein
MEGFLDGVPVLAKVSFSANEVPLLNGQPTTYGLLAEVRNGGVVRYFVPWTSVQYLRQEIPAETPGEVPVVTAPTGPDLPPGSRSGRTL